MGHKDFEKFKEAADKIERESNTPEKALEMLVKSGYLDADGGVAAKFQ